MTREEALQWLTKKSINENPKKRDEALKMAVEALQERKTGKWIIDGDKCICSSCGSDDTYNLLDYRYCPWCGVKMED